MSLLCVSAKRVLTQPLLARAALRRRAPGGAQQLQLFALNRSRTFASSAGGSSGAKTSASESAKDSDSGEASAKKESDSGSGKGEERGSERGAGGDGDSKGGFFDTLKQQVSNEAETNESLRKSLEELDATTRATRERMEAVSGVFAGARGVARDKAADAMERMRAIAKEAAAGAGAGASASGAPPADESPLRSLFRMRAEKIAELEATTWYPKMTSAASTFSTELRGAAKELFTVKDAKEELRKPLRGVARHRAAAEHADEAGAGGAADTDAPKEGTTDAPGGGAVMIVEDDGRSAFERMRARLAEAPLIQDILKQAQASKLGKAAGKAQEKARDKMEDAREFWETSQSPWVYRASSIYDALTVESEEAEAVRELRRLDPAFQLEEWKDLCVEGLLPEILSAFLGGDGRLLRAWMADGVYERVSTEIRARKEEGHDFGPSRILDIDRDFAQVVAAHVDENTKIPTLVLQFMAQQINCVRDLKTGDIVEGAEDDIRAFYYAVAFQREYVEADEDGGEPLLAWKVVDFHVQGGDAYY